MTPPLVFGCETATRRTARVNGLTLSFLEWPAPERPHVCFLHGGAAHAHWFDLVTPAFAGRFHMISLDQRGHGESDWPDPPAYATENFVADLLTLFDALGWDRVVLVGHSMGGHNAMAFAAWHPERVRGLVIADSRPVIPPDRLETMHASGRRPLRRHPTAEAAVAAFRLRPRETVADPAVLAHVARAGIVQRDGAWTFRFDPDANGRRRPVDAWTLVERITAPTLIVRAALSPGLGGGAAERLRDAIANATLVEIPGAYHHLTLDQPRRFIDELDPFLSTISGS
jgi:pimeloyl-ACP methyl ester carboxylesterase